MKISTNNAIYVQKEDIAFLNQTNLPILASIYTKVFGPGTTIIDDSNRFDFVEFNTPEEIEFLKKIDWIVDYSDVKDLTEEEIIAMAERVLEERNDIARAFNSMLSKEQKRNTDLVRRCEFLDYKICSLDNILWFRKEHIKMDLPEDVGSLSTECKKKTLN